MSVLGVKSIAPADIAADSNAVLHWLRQSGASKVLVHLDLDAIDPADMIAAVGVEPNGLKIHQVMRLIHDIHRRFDIVGLTIAEPMPRVAIKIRNMLAAMPLL